MSHVTEREIACPHCGKKQPFSFFDTINTRTDSELVRKVIDGTLFNCRCSECQKESRIGYPMVINNPDEKQMLFLAEIEDENAAMELVHALQQRDDIRGYSFRFAPDLPFLSEKLLLQMHHLDDRTVEMMKLALAADWSDDHDGRRPERIFVTEDEGLRFVLLDDSDEPLTTEFNRDMYNATWEKLSPFYPRGIRENLYVNQSWAINQLKPADLLQ